MNYLARYSNMDAKTSLVDPWSSRCCREKNKAQSESCLKVYSTASSRGDDKLIFHDVKQGELTRIMTFDILNNYKDNCWTCRGIVYRIQKLITDIEDIKNTETYAICDHCIYGEGKCKRCDYILGKLTIDQRALLEERYQRFQLWVSKTKQLLDGIMNCENVCRGKLHRQTFDAAEFENLLQELKTPTSQRHVEESRQWADKFTQCKVMLREIIMILKLTEGKKRWSPEESVNELMTKMDSPKPVVGVYEPLKQSKEGKDIKTKSDDEDEELDKQAKEKAKLKSSLTVSKNNQLKQEKQKLPFSTILTKSEKRYESQESTKQAKEKGKLRKIRGNKAVHNQQKLLRKSTFANTAESKHREVNKKLNLEVKEKSNKRQEIVLKKSRLKGEGSEKENVRSKRSNRVVDSDKLYKQERIKTKLKLKHGINKGNVDNMRIGKREEVSRKQFTNETQTADGGSSKIFSLIPQSTRKTTDCIFPEYKARDVKAGRFENIDGVKMRLPQKGPIFYKLSDKKFIEMGWTQLPALTVMRRMNVYEMEPTKPVWFNRISGDTTLTYSTGEKLASVEGGRGKWYYKNGTVALDYCYNKRGEKEQCIKKYVVYSHEEDPNKPQSVLACFDDLGNGLVYDMTGRERLKYNQSEGLLIDPKLGTPGCWKWHSLNEPPVLQQAFIDTHLKNPSPELETIMKKYRHAHVVDDESQIQKDLMLSIERQNVEKEEMAARKDKFIAFQIKIKIVKINEYFSLRILEQANINLMFRDCDKCIKLDLGMMLMSNNVIGRNMVKAFDVVTPYINPCAKSRLSNMNMAKMRETLEEGGATNEDLE